MIVSLLASCVEFGLDPVETPAPVRVAIEDRFTQHPLPATDVLFVVDDTASMQQEQLQLGRLVVALIASLDDADVAWQIGVVSTEAEGDRAGWLHGDPWVLTPSDPDGDVRLADAVTVGTTGTGPEAGFAAAILAIELSTPDGPNAGFRRPDAGLHVVFVSDSDDDSRTVLGDAASSLFLDFLAGEALNGRPALASAVVGDVPGGCTSSLGTALSADQYHLVAASSGGVVASICSDDWQPLAAGLADVVVTWETAFPLSQAPVDGSVVVTVDGVRADGGFVVVPDPPTLVFDVAPPPDADIVVSYVVEVPG